MTAPRHVFLIDGTWLIFRAYHVPNMQALTRSDGTPIGAALGFSNTLFKLLRETDADHIAVIFDAAQTSFRNRIYDAYKAQRPAPPDDLIPQFELCREATDAFGVCRIEREDFEADDLIATYARVAAAAGASVTVVSADKDLMQTVSDRVQLFDPIKDKPIGAAEVVEKFGVGPDKVIDVQALCGDSVDNVPGVPGIGVKTAAELITTYGDLETLLAHAGEIKQPKRRQSLIEFAEQARLSKRLVTLDQDVPLPVPLDDLKVKPLDRERLLTFLKAQEFRALITRVARIGSEPAPAPAAPPATNGAAAPQPLPLPDTTPVERRYELIQDLPALERWIATVYEHGFVALATETSAIDSAMAALVGLSLAVEPGRAAYLPLGHAAPDELAVPPLQVLRDQALALLKPLLEDASVLKIGHNIKYDIAVLSGVGIALAPTDCTMLMSFVLDGGQHGHELDDLAKLHFSHDTIKYKDIAGIGKDQVGFAAVPVERARDFAAEHADFALQLHRRLKPRLIAAHMLAFYETIERPLAAVVAGMERAGIAVDRGELARLSQDFSERLAALEREIYALAGHPFNIGSTKQLGEVLFDELNLPGGRKGKTGAYGTDASILEQLAPLHDLPARVLDWRQIAKLKSTYADALLDEINSATGRVHTSFSLAAASTGRLASTAPNLQNIPIRTDEGRKIRRAFVAEPGYLLISADYSQIELRLAAHVAEVEPLKAAFRAGADIHALTASEVFGIPVDGMDPMVRRRAKAINFGIIYGISAFGLAQQLGVPQGEASTYIKAYFARFPGIRDYMEKTKVQAREQGYVETLFGRRCYIAGIKDANAARRAGAERQAINAPLQGAAADIIKRAMRRIPGALARAGLTARMLLQVHDELVFEAPEDEAAATARVAKEVMEQACAPARELSVPLVVETGMARNWDDAH